MHDDTLTLRALDTGQLPALLAFFEGPAFAHHPAWRSCYCQHPLVDHRVVRWAERGAEENRRDACARVSAGTMHGLLAWRGGEVVGWCNAAPRRLVHSFDDEPDPQADVIGQVTCFVVHPGHRRSGVARALLDGACAALRGQGMQLAEATPRAEAGTDAQEHLGPLALYLGAGFTVHADRGNGHVTVRRALV